MAPETLTQTGPISTRRTTISARAAAGAGLCLAVVGVVLLVTVFTAYPLNPYLGTIPGLARLQLNWPRALSQAVAALVPIIWLALGITIIVAARRHLRAVAITGLIVVCAVLVAPAVEQAMPVFRGQVTLGSPWVWYSIAFQPLAYLVALICLVALTFSTSPRTGLKVATTVLLVGATISRMADTVAWLRSMAQLPATMMIGLLLAALFAAGWIIVALAVKSEVITAPPARVTRPESADPSRPTSLTSRGLGLAALILGLAAIISLTLYVVASRTSSPYDLNQLLTSLMLMPLYAISWTSPGWATARLLAIVYPGASIAAIVLGAIGLRTARRGAPAHKAMAVAGLVIGIVMTVLFILSATGLGLILRALAHS